MQRSDYDDDYETKLRECIKSHRLFFNRNLHSGIAPLVNSGNTLDWKYYIFANSDDSLKYVTSLSCVPYSGYRFIK